MREIKFRGMYGPIWHYGFFHKNRIGEIGIYSTQKNMVMYCNKDTIGQFTGLLDENGKGIYEGDIIKVGKKMYEVKYNQLHCCFGKFENGKFTGELYGNAFIECGGIEKSNSKVIGNIYENSDLIK